MNNIWSNSSSLLRSSRSEATFGVRLGPKYSNRVALKGFWRTLPEEIVTQHIMPYTYRKQPPQLLFDIRNYYDDYALVDEYYNHNYNQYMWLNDMVSFFTLPHFHSTKKGVDKILQRHIYYKNKDDFMLVSERSPRTVATFGGHLIQLTQRSLVEIALDQYYTNIGHNVERKVRFLWGLLLPVERTQFINKFLLE